MTQTATSPVSRRFYHFRLLALTAVAYTIGGWYIYAYNQNYTVVPPAPITTTAERPIPFPVSINPVAKVITEDPQLQTFLNSEFASNHTPPRRAQSLLALITEEIFTHHWFQQLASPSSRTLVIYSGQRTDEITVEFAKILNWSPAEVDHFKELIRTIPPTFLDGILYPGRYHVEKESSPEMVIKTITDKFTAKVRSRYTADVEAIVPLADTLIIASLIEREAYDFTDMRIISGVIWNRLFINMPLQLDATLQYVRGGNNASEWWPVPRPQDKFLNSPYNTYQNKGLPPAPIANPSVDAIIAALNPVNTDCLFYFHTNDGTFYCTPTYEEHVALLKEKFGQGR